MVRFIGVTVGRVSASTRGMTNLEVFKTIRAMGLAVAYRDGEWQIDYRREDARRSAESRYFTDDKQDAIGTARCMSLWRFNEGGK